MGKGVKGKRWRSAGTLTFHRFPPMFSILSDFDLG